MIGRNIRVRGYLHIHGSKHDYTLWVSSIKHIAFAKDYLQSLYNSFSLKTLAHKALNN